MSPAGRDALNARAAEYRLFARLFREPPSEALLRAIADDGLLTLAEQAGHSTGSGRPFDLAEDPAWPKQVDAIAIEYTRLFAAPGAAAVHPYESVYCDRVAIDNSTACSAYFAAPSGPSEVGGLLHGPSTVAVREAYRRSGMDVDPASHHLPDHLAIELEFMGCLINGGAHEEAAVFFREHLGRWVGRCLEDIRQRAAAGFFRVVADTAGAFLQREQRLFSDPELERAGLRGCRTDVNAS